MKKLIMFVMVLVIAAPVVADDLNPPDWAGGENCTYAIWEFTEDPGTEGDYIPADDYAGSEESHFDEGGYGDQLAAMGEHAWEATYEGREGVAITPEYGEGWFRVNNWDSPGEHKRIQIQMVVFGFDDGFGFESETADSGEWIWIEGYDSVTELDREDLGGGWEYIRFEYDFEARNPAAEYFCIFADALDEVVFDSVCYDGDEPPDGPGRSGGGVPNPIIIDPNVMTVYETDETEGDFTVRLRNEPETGATVTVVIDPNGGPGGGNPDLILLGSTMGPGDDAFDNRVHITFTDPNNFSDPNWNEPQVVRFRAVEDSIPEPEGEGFDDPHTILVSSYYLAHPTDANYVGEKSVAVTVTDNDKADILFELVGTGPIRGTAVKLFEHQLCTIWVAPTCYNWVAFSKTIGVTLQVEPENDESPGSQGYVRVIVSEEGGAGNPPIMDPCLLPEHAHTPGDPNAIVFTSDGNPVSGVIGAVTKWDVPFNIVVEGNDDEELQIEEAFADGDQYYNANLVFWVESTSDGRYTVWDEEDEEYYGMERSVDIDIEDNECGALGILPVDISNPYYLMDEETLGGDPNDWVYDDGSPMPDCYVDIYDVIEMASRWLNCTEPLDPSCWE